LFGLLALVFVIPVLAVAACLLCCPQVCNGAAGNGSGGDNDQVIGMFTPAADNEMAFVEFPQVTVVQDFY
jgi:hypothetical protein